VSSASGGIFSIGLLLSMELHQRVQTLRSVFVFFVVLLFLFSSISNGNWTDWSPIRSVIIRVITKLLITSLIAN